MKLFNLFLLIFISLPASSQDNYRSSFDSFKNGTIYTKSWESMTERKSRWCLVNDKPNEVDLSE